MSEKQNQQVERGTSRGALVSLTDYAYRFRYVIALLLVVIGVALNLNGSSIAIWGNYVPTEQAGTIYGTPRAIRSDEYGTLTAMTISQGYGEQPYDRISHIIRGDETDVFIVYGQPTKDVFSVLFRPFLTGFLLFGSERGLAFYWCARFAALFLVSFELGMLITEKKRGLSLAGAILVSLAPIVQWWFAINGLVEMLVFGGLAVLMLQRYMRETVFWKRLPYLFVMYCCAGGYVMTFYPAWMIPLVYVFVALAIWVFCSNVKECRMRVWDVLALVVTVLLLGGSLLYVFGRSKDVVEAVLNTAYPGQRNSLGGGELKGLFRGIGNLLFPDRMDGIPLNSCESAVFLDFFPLGILVAIYAMWKNRKADLLSLALMVVAAFLGAYSVLGFPSVLASITLLGKSTSVRALVGIGFANVLLLLRGASILRERPPVRDYVILALACVVLSLVGSKLAYADYFCRSDYLLVLLVVVVASGTLLYGRKAFGGFLITSLVLSFYGGAYVNPIQRGTAGVTETELARSIQEIVEEDPEAKWVAESLPYPMINYPIMQGAPTINSTSTYPDMKRWKKLDETGQYEEIYNRYAHILVEITEPNVVPEAKFELPVADSFKVYLSLDELHDMGVRYVLTSRELNGFGDGTYDVTLRKQAQGYWIYEICSETEMAGEEFPANVVARDGMSGKIARSGAGL